MNLPPQFRWSSSGVTDVGRTRLVNEDAVGLRPEIGLWVVADGMGGHKAGDVASAAIVQSLNEVTYPSDINRFVESVEIQLQDVNSRLVLKEGTAQTGSTVVVLLAHGSQCACLWAGDSRVYRLRKGVLHAMTRDHSYVQELVESGELAAEEAANHPGANVITRAIGAHESIDIEVGFHELQDGDRYLLCSDGLYREISEQELCHHMSEGDCTTLVHKLLALTLDRGAHDNVSIVAVDFVGN